jgi:hypothetical protein
METGADTKAEIIDQTMASKCTGYYDVRSEAIVILTFFLES